MNEYDKDNGIMIIIIHINFSKGREREVQWHLRDHLIKLMNPTQPKNHKRLPDRKSPSSTSSTRLPVQSRARQTRSAAACRVQKQTNNVNQMKSKKSKKDVGKGKMRDERKNRPKYTYRELDNFYAWYSYVPKVKMTIIYYK